MINFHNYGFLDCKKLKMRLADSNTFLSYYNPIWLFLWSDVYHPEISFGNEYIFIRVTIPNLGKCYYPPIPVMGGTDIAMTIVEMELETADLGIDFYLGPVLDESKRKYKNLGISLYPNKYLSNYIYSAADLTFVSNRYKKQRRAAEIFKKKNKNLFYKLMKKEDFPMILEFISKVREENNIDKDNNYFAELNMIKKCFEHLYELDLLGMILMNEENVFGFVIGSVVDNCTYIHARMSVKIFGAQDELMAAFARYASAKAKYIAIDCKKNTEEEKICESLYPMRIENFNGSFSI